MDNLDELISSIEGRLRKLIDHNEKLEIEKEGLIARNKELSQGLQEQNEEIKELKKNFNLTTYSESIKNSKGNAEAKKYITELVREIDKCITVLKQT